MTPKQKQEYETAAAYAELARDEILQAPELTVRELRGIYPDLPARELLGMARLHPQVQKDAAYWTGRLKHHRAVQARLRAGR